jgi:hypothetical protein
MNLLAGEAGTISASDAQLIAKKCETFIPEYEGYRQTSLIFSRQKNSYEYHYNNNHPRLPEVEVALVDAATAFKEAAQTLQNLLVGQGRYFKPLANRIASLDKVLENAEAHAQEGGEPPQQVYTWQPPLTGAPGESHTPSSYVTREGESHTPSSYVTREGESHASSSYQPRTLEPEQAYSAAAGTPYQPTAYSTLAAASLQQRSYSSRTRSPPGEAGSFDDAYPYTRTRLAGAGTGGVQQFQSPSVTGAPGTSHASSSYQPRTLEREEAYSAAAGTPYQPTAYSTLAAAGLSPSSHASRDTYSTLQDWDGRSAEQPQQRQDSTRGGQHQNLSRGLSNTTLSYRQSHPDRGSGRGRGFG